MDMKSHEILKILRKFRDIIKKLDESIRLNDFKKEDRDFKK